MKPDPVAPAASSRAGEPATEPLVSVLTPVYNGEQYLGECIESVLRQTYQNWEYVIVDNASTDRSLAIAREYAEQDRRVSVSTYDELVPVIQNWNRTLRHAPSKAAYCKFVHADDLLFPECIAQMVALAEANPSVAIVNSYQLKGTEVVGGGFPISQTVFPGRAIGRYSLLGGRAVFGTPTSTLFRARPMLDRDPLYDESNHHADQKACYELLRDADFGFVHQVLSYTRKHPQSVTGGMVRGTWISDQISLLLEFGPEYLAEDEYRRRLTELIARYRLLVFKQLLRRRYRTDERFRTYHAEIRERLRQDERVNAVGSLAFVRAAVAQQTLALAHRLSRRLASPPAPPQGS